MPLNNPSAATAAAAHWANGEHAHRGKRILVVDDDPALFDLLSEWLVACGHTVYRQTATEGAATTQADLIILDIPFPRQGIRDAIRKVSLSRPSTPIIALSSTFLPGVESHGAVARELGVSAVTAKPLQQETFVALVASHLRGHA